MPELPDVTVYVECLERRIVGEPLERARLRSPFLLRTAAPRLEEAEGRTVGRVFRIGKRIVLGLDGALFLVFHLMIAGRFRWTERGRAPRSKIDLAAFDFPSGELLLTEAGTRKRASLHVVLGDEALAAHDPGGIDPIGSSAEAFDAAIRRENHTLKRALTDPRILSGIGNAYSDEILHRARLSPAKRTKDLGGDEVRNLRDATVAVLSEWTRRLRDETAGSFPGPGRVTAFREGMAVHGRFGKPCPACGSPVQRIAYAENEANYCSTCQTGGRLLADRSLSRLFRGDWPRTLEEMEALRGRA